MVSELVAGIIVNLPSGLIVQAALYNGRAACYMKMGRWEDADHDLQEAFSKDAKDPDTLSNLITVGLHLGKNVARYQT